MGEAAVLPRIDRQDVERVEVEGLVQMSRREDRLVGQDRHRHSTTDLGHQADPVPRRGLLRQGEVEGEQRLDRGDRLVGRRVGAVGVDGEDRLGAEPLPDGPQAGDVVDPRHAGLELERADAPPPELDGQAHRLLGRIAPDAHAGRDPLDGLPVGDEARDGDAPGAAPEVPQGDVDGRLREGVAVEAAVHQFERLAPARRTCDPISRGPR